MAKDIPEALRKEKTYSPDEVWLDEDWKHAFDEANRAILIGFKNKNEGKQVVQKTCKRV